MPLRRAALALEIPPEKDLAALLTGLADADPAARRQAAQALVLSPTPAPARVAALGRCLAAEPEDSVREMLLTGLVEIGGAEAAQILAALVTHKEIALRSAVLAALRRLGPATAEVVAALQASPLAAHRVLAAEIMRGWPTTLAAPALAAWLPAETDETVLTLLLELATAHGDARLLPALAGFPREEFLGFGAALAAAAIRRRDAP